MDTVPCGALLVHRSGRIAYMNSSLCQMVDGDGTTVGADRFAQDIFPEGPMRDHFFGTLRDFDLPSEIEGGLLNAQGASIPVILSGRRLTGDSPLSEHRLFTVIDITIVKQAEQRYRDLFTEVSRLSDTILEQAMELKGANRRLEEKVTERTAELHDANMDAIYMLALAGETKDLDTGAHVRRIETYARLLSLELGLPPEQARRIGYSAILHDIGKMMVPDAILKKPAALDSDERRHMEEHTIAGERILADKPFFDIARQIARSHHENWDGSGYPDGLRGEQTPLPARIVHLVDVFDALVSERVYKPSWSVEEALAEMSRGVGVHFDPRLFAAFERVLRRPDFRDTMNLLGAQLR